jgi:tellurite resistance protein TerA
MAIRLEKTGDTHRIDLTKRGNNPQKEIIINLNWSQGKQAKQGGWSKFWSGDKSIDPIDLDLGCFYELRDGYKNVIDGIQFSHGQGGNKNQSTRQGCYTQEPWIWHSGDDRSGAATEGENMLINPQGASDLKRMTIYCFIYEGAAKWQETNAVVTIKVPGNEDIVVEMGKQYSDQTFCAIAEILFGKDNSMTVKKLVSFHNGHYDCDTAYNWGFEWQEGNK